MSNFPLVFVIVVNYNGEKYLKACLSSLEAQAYPNYKTVVYDNASTDSSREYVTENYKDVRLIAGERNVGFALANNLAMKFALSQRAEYVFLLNNDTALEKDTLQKLVDTAEAEHSIGIVGPAVFDLGKKDSVQEMGMAIDRFGYPLAIKSSVDEGLSVFFVSGCAMLIKADLLKSTGFFDSRYFMFAEDLDLCWRARLAGFNIVVNEDAKLYHASGASIAGGVIKESSYRTNVQRIFLRERNTLRTLIKNYGLRSMFRVVPFYVGLLLFESVFWLLVFKPRTSVNILKGIFWNVKVFPDTFVERSKIQVKRVVGDGEVLKKMAGGYCKLNIFGMIGVPKFVEKQS